MKFLEKYLKSKTFNFWVVIKMSMFGFGYEEINGKKLSECGIKLGRYEELLRGSVVESYHDGSILNLGTDEDIETNPVIFARKSDELYKVILSQSEDGMHVEEVVPVEKRPIGSEEGIESFL